MTEFPLTPVENYRGKDLRRSRGISAIIWDYDGTLVDTSMRNLHVTRGIVGNLSGRDPAEFPSLRSLEQYAVALARSVNWRDFYRSEFNFGDAEIDEAGRRWTEFQMRDRTPAPLYDGIRDVLHNLRDIPHGIVSQNSSAIIRETLDGIGLSGYFGSIVGFEEVELRRQKPAPDGLLRCIEVLTRPNGGRVLYIGDHPTDALCAQAANATLQHTQPPTRVSSVAALYSSKQATCLWPTRPDYAAREVPDLVHIVENLSTMADQPASSP